MSIAFGLYVCSSEVDDVVLRIVRMPSIPILVTVSYFADLKDITYKDICGVFLPTSLDWHALLFFWFRAKIKNL